MRLGYGETGNQDIAPYSTYQRFVTGVNAPINGSSLITGISLGVPVDENLTWETTKQVNLGVDFALLKGRINTSIDLYQKNTTDLLVKLPQPLTLGGGTLLTNAGEIKNSGVDLSVRSTVIDKEDFKWDANFNISYVKNEVVDISDLPNIFQSINVGTNTNAFIIEKGQPIGNFYGATYLGAWQTGENPDQVAGSAKYELDENGEIVQGVIGNGVPTTTWGD
nr:TonB-dependent receptor [Algibacter lectus]